MTTSATVTAKPGDPKNVQTPEFRVSYPHLFKAQAGMDGGEAKYSIAMLFPLGADLSKLKTAAHAAVVEKWGPDQAKWPKHIRSPFRDQGEKVGDGYVAGAIFCNASSKQRPGVVDNLVRPITDESQVYAGCYGRATLRAFAYDNKGNKGVSFGLQNFQKTRDGDPISGRNRPDQDFQPVENVGGDGQDASALFGGPSAAPAAAAKPAPAAGHDFLS